MPRITLYEHASSRSARCRWTLLEAGLDFDSVDNPSDFIGSEEFAAIHPLSKLPAAVIDGQALFESAAISTAVADLVPERELVAKPGTWARALHDQWVSFALTEMEPWLWSSEINSVEILMPKERQVPAIVPQNNELFRRSAAVLDAALDRTDYLIEDRFTVTDIIVGYTVSWGETDGLLDGFENLSAYLDRLRTREHCTLPEPG